MHFIVTATALHGDNSFPSAEPTGSAAVGRAPFGIFRHLHGTRTRARPPGRGQKKLPTLIDFPLDFSLRRRQMHLADRFPLIGFVRTTERSY